MPAGDRSPFDYPQKPHRRRHDPPKFKVHEGFKDYLRDEFIFTCVYCLSRETWNPGAAFFGVDHYFPKSRHEAGRLAYANLVYACNECNRAKGVQLLPAELHPEENPYGKHLAINRDGSIKGIPPHGDLLIGLLRLDREELNRWRRVHYDIYEEAMRKPTDSVAQQRLRDFFGFPTNMPDFARRRGAVNPYATRANRPDWY
jgi:5-methylcytosine-specific restriction endonuclease McrA